MATKVWSNKAGIIRDADSSTVKRWMPDTGFAREGNVIHTESAPKKVRTSSPNGESGGASSSADPLSAAAAPTQSVEIPLTPTEEALVSVAALRLLPDELESLRQQAFKEGEAEGQKRGYAEGIAAGKAEAELTFEGRFKEAMEPYLQEAQRPLIKMFETIEAEIPTLDTSIAENILDLALVLAQQMTCKAVAFNPKIILTILNEAILALPREARGWLRIYVHPEDAAMLRGALASRLNDDEHRIIEDLEISRGGCRLVSRMGELDATLEGRWHVLLKNLGRDASWLKLDNGVDEVADKPVDKVVGKSVDKPVDKPVDPVADPVVETVAAADEVVLPPAAAPAKKPRAKKATQE